MPRRSPTWRVRVVVLVAACAPTACGWAAGPPLAGIRAEVVAATAGVRLPDDPAARAAAVHRLVALHDRLTGDPRFPASPELRALRGRVAARLTRLGGSLARDLRSPPVSAGAPGGGAAGARALIDLIQATVQPQAWDVNGGTGSIVYFANGHALVVRAPQDVHEDLDDLLRQLR